VGTAPKSRPAPPEQPTIPELRRSAEDEYVAHTHVEKAALLVEKFFPDPEANLDDIVDTTLLVMPSRSTEWSIVMI
jgi:hypothetical protein